MTERLTKTQAAARFGISTKTLDRRIARGELEVEREPDGRRRVMVLLDSMLDSDQDTLDNSLDSVHDNVDRRLDTVQDTPATNGVGDAETEVEVLRARVAELESLHRFDQERLVLADERLQDMRQVVTSSQQTIDRLTLMLPAPSTPAEPGPRRWWRFWRRDRLV